MRPILSFLILMIPSIAFSQDCHTSDIPVDGAFTCPDTLFIDTPLVRRNPDISTIRNPLIITADNIVITANISMDGADGINSVQNTDEGGPSGYGGSPGGSILTSTPTPGGLGDPEDGKEGDDEAGPVCASGGGGGGSFSSAGQQGSPCRISSSLNGATPGGNGGNLVTLSFIGGYGGGAGGFANSFNTGLGGGGGGVISLEATVGTITIANGVRISSRGGKGGNSTGIGGAGGGGGGGQIILKSPVTIINQGILDVRGGAAGVNTSGTFPRGGNGGLGGNGIFILDQISVQTTGTGEQDFSTGIPTSSTSSLKSDISCGTLAKKNDNQMMFQMMIGFLSVMLLGFFSRKRRI